VKGSIRRPYKRSEIMATDWKVGNKRREFLSGI